MTLDLPAIAAWTANNRRTIEAYILGDNAPRGPYAKKPKPTGPPDGHGMETGYRWHRSTGNMPACDDCRAAHNAYSRRNQGKR